MGREIIYNINKDTQPFIMFDVEINSNKIISCIGYEFVCSNPKCDCQSVSIGIIPRGTKDTLTYITYGWRDYEYYISRGHTEDYAKDITQGKLSNPETEQTKSILLAFRRWLMKDKATNDRIIRERYEKFKFAVSNKGRNSKLKKLFSLMLELFGEEKVNEFIASCEEKVKVSYILDKN